MQALGRLGGIRLTETRVRETLGGEELDLGERLVHEYLVVRDLSRDERPVNTSLRISQRLFED